MNGVFSPGEVLGAMITPAVLISASGTLVLSTSNRMTRVVDRVRSLAREAQQLPAGERPGERARLIAEQLPRLAERVILLRSALTVFYVTIGLLVVTSISVGIMAALQWEYGWIPVVTGLSGACTLLFGSLLLLREARLALTFTLQEMDYLRTVVERMGASAQGPRNG
jgi:hypothetical protein